jgi:probable F420-dependent oxidoreductase
MKVRFAVTPPTEVLVDEFKFGAYLHACEELGFDTLWLSDLPLGPSGDPIISLAFAAASTSRLKLGMNVVPLGRNPLWLAKQLAQIDRLSQGRLLVSFVPGLGSPPERAALGHASGDRGASIDRIISLLRAWWSGEHVTDQFEGFNYEDVSVLPTPVQDPLEIWLGGIGPLALERVARSADGWLTANATPAEANQGLRTINQRAQELGRTIDHEHFGISIPYAQVQPKPNTIKALQARRPDSDLSDILPVGKKELRRLLRAHIDSGLSKFVLRPVTTGAAKNSPWFDELRWLADAVLEAQT